MTGQNLGDRGGAYVQPFRNRFVGSAPGFLGNNTGVALGAARLVMTTQEQAGQEWSVAGFLRDLGYGFGSGMAVIPKRSETRPDSLGLFIERMGAFLARVRPVQFLLGPDALFFLLQVEQALPFDQQ